VFELKRLGKVTVIYSRLKGFASASVGVFLRIGARYEGKHLKGIAHFLEHMLFKGTKKYSYKEIKQEIEGRGGYLNGFTSQEVTAYYSQCLSKNIEKTLDILLDMVTSPRLDVKEIEKERRVILEEIKMYNDLPASRVSTVFDSILWEGHPLGEDVIGSVDTVKGIKRRDLSDFRSHFYAPSNIIVAVAGDYPLNNLSSFLKKRLQVSSQDKLSARQRPPLALKGLKVKVENRPLDQARLCLGFRGPSHKSNDRLVVEIIHSLLGANMSSRLFEVIREKKALAYSVHTESRKHKDSGAFIVSVGLDKKNIFVAIKSIIKELERIKKYLVGQKELERAKDYLLGQLAMNIEKPSGRMFYLADSLISRGSIDTFDELKEKIHGIGPERIRRASANIFDTKRMCIACVGNVDTKLTEELKTFVTKEQ